jgi:hypothetical protein
MLGLLLCGAQFAGTMERQARSLRSMNAYYFTNTSFDDEVARSTSK